MSKKILVITASPRGNGNTNTIANCIVDGAEKAGGRVELVDVTDLDCKVIGCNGCNRCQPDSLSCVVEDDITDLVADFPKYDAIVFVTPIYFFSFPAQLKVAIDRMYCLLLHESGQIFSPLKRIQFAVAASAGGNEENSGIEIIKEQMGYLEELIECPPTKFLFKGNCQNKDTAAKDTAFLEEATAFGASLVKNKVSEKD
ncbi:MAG: flavodoxin family protein [Victivallaceae bacterium]|nr:flavodoxin family protein [Victivallaceae bacterium]